MSPWAAGPEWERQLEELPLPAPLRRTLAEPVPRSIPPGTFGRLLRGTMGMAFWVGVGLCSVGGAYSVIFFAMGAPWQIPAAAAGVAFLGLLSLAWCLARACGRRYLLRRGELGEAVLEAIGKPDAGLARPFFGVSTEVVYRFVDPQGKEHRRRTVLLWDEGLRELEPGSRLKLLYDTRHPRWNLPLVALLQPR
ncbi:MAG: hypothetical protein GXP48_02655 [Acidobacteria bacterium]|nr:hypothetical protein [Acidobacteriota bacterium]